MANFHSQSNQFSSPLNGAGAVFQGSNLSGRDFYFSAGRSPESQREDAIAALFLTNPRDDRAKHITFKGEVTPGTCTWINEDKIFAAWRNDLDRGTDLVWLAAGSGKGKTMLSIFVTQQLETWATVSRRRLLLYYFCDGRDESRNTAVAILRSLIYQMIRQVPNLVEILLKSYIMQKANLFRPTAIEPLWHIFETMVQESGQEVIYCWIDGADECEVDSLHHLLKKLRSFFQRARPGQTPDVGEANKKKKDNSAKTILRMMVVSREEPPCLTQELSSFSRLKLGSDSSENTSQAIQVFIKAKAKEISAATGGSKVEEGLVSAALENKAEGNFLWVNVAAEKLKRSNSVHIKEQLQHLSPDVSEIYAQILEAVPAEWTLTVQALLKWVLVATRPLKLVELVVAVRLACRYDVSLQQLQAAISLCGSLLVVQRQECLLAHHSVYDFFLGQDSRLHKNPRLSNFVFRESLMHSELTNHCVSYLQSGPLIVKKGFMKSLKLTNASRVATADGSTLSASEKKHLEDFPFMNYAVLNWPNHARMGDAMYTDYNSSFFAQKSEIRDVWWETHWLSTKARGAWKLTVPRNFTPLHMAAAFGIVPLALDIESKGYLWDAMQVRDSHSGSPIEWAISKVQPQMTSFLFDRGALNIPPESLNPIDARRSLLNIAVSAGEAETVTYLLQSDENPQQLMGGYTLDAQGVMKMCVFAAKNWRAAVDEVMENVHSSDMRRYLHNGSNESALHTSAAHGSLDVCRVLLQYGADANAVTDTQWQPIHDAAWYGFPEVIKLLIRHGADPKAQANDYYTPLHCAVHEAHTECVRLLLEYDKTLDIRNTKGREPLHTAAKSGNTAIVELLLDAGANVNALCTTGCTPLFYAASHGMDETLECLLDRGADIEIKKPPTEENGEPTSVFDIAKSKGHKTTLALLNSHAQGERKTKKRPTLTSESSQPDQSASIATARPAQNPEAGATTGPSSTHPEPATETGFKYRPPPPLVRPVQMVSAPGFAPAPGHAAAPSYAQPAPAVYVPSVQVSVPPPTQTYPTQPNPVQAGFVSPLNPSNKPDIPPTLPPRPASSSLPHRPHTNSAPVFPQPATAPPMSETQFAPPPQPGPISTAYGPPPPYSLTTTTATNPQPAYPAASHLVPTISTQMAPPPSQIYQSYQGYPPPLQQTGNPSFLTPQMYYPPPQGFAPAPTSAFPIQNAPVYFPGQSGIPPPPPRQVKKSKSMFDLNIMGKKIL